ncbi:MAG: hypothetical protein ACPGJE_04490 [Wenzhouxiangellaceae bacterium]
MKITYPILSSMLMLLLTLAGNPAGAQQPAIAPGSLPDDAHWLAERAAASDLVLLAQLDQIDYQYRRDFPVGGESWFRPLISYKSSIQPRDLLIVQEQGLKENGCYFPEPLPWDERRRYLLFLLHDPATENLRGHPDGCAIEILVNDANQYVARWPQSAFGGENGRGDEAVQALVEKYRLQGPGSRIDVSDLLEHQRRARAERDFMRIEGTDLIPTRGINLTALRGLMQSGLREAEADNGRSERMRELRDRMLEQVRENGG